MARSFDGPGIAAKSGFDQLDVDERSGQRRDQQFHYQRRTAIGQLVFPLESAITRCSAGVRQWFENAAEDELFISVLVLGEIRRVIERIRPRDPAQARALEKWLLWVATEFADRLLPVDEKVAGQW